MPSWWAGKIRRVRIHLGAQVSLAEREAIARGLTPAQLALFDGMHPADRRHGLDVRSALLAEGERDPDLLLAALLHDCAKGPETGLVPRILWALSVRYAPGTGPFLAALPAVGPGVRRMRDHALRSAELAAAAGCSPRTVDLIARQEAPADPAGLRLARADEAMG